MWCKYCKEDKPRSEFRKHSRKCYRCQADYTAKWRERNPEKAKAQIAKFRAENKEHLRAYNLRRYRSPDYKRPPGYQKHSEKWRKSNPTKRNAHQRVYTAIRNGMITKAKACQQCGDDYYIVAHHEDYTKPLDVMWLCQSCHRHIHRA